jgi:hypothetical protein
MPSVLRATLLLARCALRKLESKKIAYESLVLSLLLYGSECWVVT